MKNIPIAAKIVMNIILFIVYAFIWIFIWNFLYWLIQFLLKNPVASSTDPIHKKIAIISMLIVLLVSWLLRKYFYFPVCVKNEDKQINKNEKNSTKQVIEEEKIINEEPKMKIYIDKEIK